MIPRAEVTGAEGSPLDAEKLSKASREAVWTCEAIPEPVPVTEGTIDVGGARLWYWDTGGSGQPVVLLHSGSQSGAGWDYQQPVFARAGFRVIGYSRRGCFRSDTGSPDDPGCASEDLRFLVDALNLGRVHLVAIALGAFYAVDFALVYPRSVRTLTIASSYLGIDESEREYADANARLKPKEFHALPCEFKELHPSYRAGNPSGVAAWLALSKQAIPGIRIDQKRPYKLTWPLIETISHPTLLMTGDGDLYTPPALLRMQALHWRQSEVAIVKEAGHCANWEQPQVFNAVVLEFLNRHSV